MNDDLIIRSLLYMFLFQAQRTANSNNIDEEQETSSFLRHFLLLIPPYGVVISLRCGKKPILCSALHLSNLTEKTTPSHLSHFVSIQPLLVANNVTSRIRDLLFHHQTINMPCVMRSFVFYLLLVVGVQGFGLYPPNYAIKSALKTSSSDYSVSDRQRRDLFVASTATTFAAVIFSGRQRAQTTMASNLETTAKTLSFVESVDQALQSIDAECDRRFLHAVVTSDYQLLYKGLSWVDNRISLCNAPDNLLQRSEDAPLFRTLEKVMQQQPLQPSTSRIAVANSVAAQRMGTTVCSIWPLGSNVHFAWLENGTSFRGTWNTKMIIDGVDCGRMSLEDALESNKEILFRSERYLAVPLSMEQELIQKLKNSFII